MQLTSLIRCALASRPDGIATEFEGRKRNWREFNERVARLAGALLGSGVEAGDRVAILALNSDRYLEYFFAVWWAGAVVVPMNTRWSVAENVYSLKDSGARVLFVDETFVTQVGDIRSQTEQLQTIIYLGDGEGLPGLPRYEALIKSSESVPDAKRAGEDLAGLFYTGGTTGFPKGVMLPHRALWFNSLIGATHFCFEPGSRFLHVAPMFHLADLIGSLSTLAVQGVHVFTPGFDAAKLLDIIADEKISHALLVPTALGLTLQHPGFDCRKLETLVHVFYGSSPIPEGVLRDAMERMPGVRFTQCYGQTELAPIITILPAENHVLEGPGAGKLRSAGRPAMGVEVRILDESGDEVPRGEVGELVASGPGTMLGYWNQTEQTAAALHDGVVNTGDAAYIDEDGFVFIVDRLKDMIVSGGENVFCAEVESAISTHPGVAEVAVFGIPSAQWGEAVHAVVVLNKNAGVSAQEIIAHSRLQIARYKCPRSVGFSETSLPLSGAGKVLKRELRAPFWTGRGRAVN